MDVEEFRKSAKEMVDYICSYFSNVSNYDVAPNVEPGYLKSLLPDKAPEKGESYKAIMKDFDEKIMPGMLHWCHPDFYAYFPSGNSFPSILGDMLSDATGAIGFSWASCPAQAELENVMTDWWAKALGIPDFFQSKQSNPKSIGGGSIQGSASEAIYVAVMAARAWALKKLKGNSTEHDSHFLPQLVAYTSREAHSSIEKACVMALVKLRILDPDEEYESLRGETVEKAIKEDIAAGLTPFLVIGTLGSTSQCAFDKIKEIGEVTMKYPNIWFHVDGAYAGNSFVCPENRHIMDGIEYANSFNTNGNKFLLLNFDCSVLFAKDVMTLTSGFVVDPVYLQHEQQEFAIDYRHYGIPLSRRFRALKLFFLFRTYGIEGLQKYIRNHQKLAKYFESLVRKDDRFEINNHVHLGLVCFRLKKDDEVNRNFMAKINGGRKLHLTPSIVKGKYSVRFCVCYEHAKPEHIDKAWKLICQYADEALAEANKTQVHDKKYLRQSFTMEMDKAVTQRLSDFATPIIVKK